jgi:hypothetical protein
MAIPTLRSTVKICFWGSLLYVLLFLCVLADGMWFQGRILAWLPTAAGNLLEGRAPGKSGSESGGYLYGLSVLVAVIVLLASSAAMRLWRSRRSYSQ